MIIESRKTPHNPKNILYYGDNLGILREHIKKDSIDLVYLDPPFNTSQTYNILFKEQDGTRAASQIKAFDDTWTYDEQAALAYKEVRNGPSGASRVIGAFMDFLGTSNMMAYLSNMAIRLLELHRILKPTGSLYLHCDPTTSHYLKILLDAIFGPTCFRNEITWKRTTAHSDSKRYGANVDIILFYTKSDRWTWNQVYQPHDEEYIARFRHRDPDGRQWSDYDLTAKGLSGGGYDYEYKGVLSHWRCPLETMERLDKEGRLHFTNKGGIRLKRYLDENKGNPLQCLWDDISPINSQAKERLGYPTQKPLALMRRIIEVSSNEGDLILDPFCGCGTTVAAAQEMNRSWIGIDITHLAITHIKNRLRDAFGEAMTFNVVGEPASHPDAIALAKQDPFQFQWWLLGLVGARPVEKKKGADRGIDGYLFFYDEHNGKEKKIIFSVKGGHIKPSDLRDLRGVVEREKAQIGVLLTLSEPTKPMQTEALSAGYYESPIVGEQGMAYPRIQILTVEEILEGKQPLFPNPLYGNVTFSRAPKAEKNGSGETESFV